MNEKWNENSNEGTDPLSRFMFGSSGKLNHNPEKDTGELKREEFNDESVESRRAMQDEWLFGARAKESEENRSHNNNNNKVEQILNNINIGELMDNIDILVNSAGQLKPLLKKASPIIDQFLKK